LDTEDHHAVISATREERTRIAGELHDVIGHCLSVIVLQAGGARMLVRSDPDRAGAALQVVQQAGHDALIELRRLLTVLGDTSLPAETGPLPGIDDLAPLVARTTGTALRVDLEVEGTTRPVSASVGLCAYRIVQEALTNVIKHADAARAKVSLAWAPDALELEIADDGHGLATFRAEGVGRGLIGMRERVAVLDGSLHTGSSVRGGFVVHASLPLAEELA
ncbi:MAG TPA: histidine kinase, partial [Acidimicrobiales bacterium]|nr:histidine kinase [Acidimicrobiales bacterium]